MDEIEYEIVSILQRYQRPLSPQDVYDLMARIQTSDVCAAVWRLVDYGKLTFTDDRKIILC